VARRQTSLAQLRETSFRDDYQYVGAPCLPVLFALRLNISVRSCGRDSPLLTRRYKDRLYACLFSEPPTLVYLCYLYVCVVWRSWCSDKMRAVSTRLTYARCA
jgi:hypothetical protein